MKYFVSSLELFIKDKSAIVAGFLSIFLGSFGLHRFYLGRKQSGFLILASTVLSFGIASLFWVPFTLIEGLMLLSKHRAKGIKGRPINITKVTETTPIIEQPVQPSVTTPGLSVEMSHSRGVASSITADPMLMSDMRMKPQSIVMPVETQHNSLEIYDVSDIEVSPIVTPSVKVSTTSVYRDWVSELEIPYERKNLRIAQLRESVYALYEQLAKFIDAELRQQGSSLDKLRVSMLPDQYTYYSNVLYTIFCIAEGHVMQHYIGSYGYDNSFSYDLLKKKTSAEFVRKVEAYAREQTKHLQPVSDEIKRAYGLAPNGLTVEWWDSDGQIREHYRPNEALLRILRYTPPRTTKLYEIPEVRMYIFQHYLQSLAVLHKQRKEVGGWKVRIGKYLDEVLDGDSYISNPQNFMILNQILKLSEQAVRKSLPYTKPLDITKEIISIRKTIPTEAANAVTSYAVRLEEPLKPSIETLKALALQNPSAWKYDIENLEDKSLQDIIKILRKYEEPATIDKIAKEIVKKRPEADIQLVALYATQAANSSPVDWVNKRLSKIVHPAQSAVYMTLVTSRKSLNVALVSQLIALTKPPLRRVVLDRDRMARAVQDHNHAVKTVSDYLGDDENDLETSVAKSVETPPTPKPMKPVISREALFATTSDSDDVSLDDGQKEFLRIITATSDGIDLTTASAHAKAQSKMLNGYIQTINKALYESFDDQVITQNDGKIMVEQEYRDAVKELI